MNNLKDIIIDILVNIEENQLEELVHEINLKLNYPETLPSKTKTKALCIEYLKDKYNVKGSPARGQRNYWIMRGYSAEYAENAIKEYSSVYSSNSVNDVMKRHNVSKDEATQIIKDRSKRGLETFNKKYSEDEKRKIHSLKAVNDLENCIRLYGEKEGPKIYEERRKNLSKNVSKAGFIERYGEDLGLEKYKQFCEGTRKQNTLEGYIERYGKERGEKEFKKTNALKAFAHSKQGYISKYGYMLGTKKFKERQEKWQKSLLDRTQEELDAMNKSKGKTFDELAQRHGQEKAELIIRKRMHKFTAGKASKESLKLFIPIYKHLRRNCGLARNDILWGIDGSSEFFISDDGKFFLYDFTIPKLNLIIEYHGIAWHGTSENDNRINPYGVPLKETFIKDQHKKRIAEQNGFDVIVVWSTDNPIETENMIKDVINEKIKNDI